VRHQQLGLVWEHDAPRAARCACKRTAGERRVVQFLSVPVAAQANPLSGGGVVDLDSDFAGIDLRWSLDTQAAGRPLRSSPASTPTASASTGSASRISPAASSACAARCAATSSTASAIPTCTCRANGRFGERPS
jgi:hypothetical protein